MRTRPRFGRFGFLTLSLAASVLVGLVSENTARAENDSFGLGDGHSGAKTAAGAEVINAYAPITADVALGATQIAIGTAVGNAQGFAGGDLILIWRATGVPAADAPSGSQSRLTLGGAAGKYEFARVASVSGGTLRLTNPVVNAWAKDVTQVIKVREYTTLNVPAGTSLVAHPWGAAGTGFAGGMLVFLANGAVTLRGKLDADGRGFRGGAGIARVNLALVCDGNDGAPADGFASKGEGVVNTEYGPTKGGRGNRANGAGGGNCFESGGGGGGNFGPGGNGGNSVLSSRDGLGGTGLDYSLLERISLGGGGGAGEHKDTISSAGGAGGGAIFVRVQTLSGNGTFSAAGLKADNSGVVGGLVTDGAGGGGAGGSVVVRVAGSLECDGLGARGGAGGDSQILIPGVSVFGTGGGGGGGRVLVQAGTVSPACTPNTTPGNGGNNNGGGSTGGGGGTTEPGPGGAFCTGPFGTGPAPACQVQTQPVCTTNGSCKACDGDYLAATPAACQLFGSPVCFTTAFTDGPPVGSCDQCKRDAHCQTGPGHNSSLVCHLPAGICGTGCENDTQCKTNEWCSPNTGGSTKGVCVPKTPNGQPLPGGEPIKGECTVPNGNRVCLSAVCEEDDDKCGKKNGKPCDVADGGTVDSGTTDGGTVSHAGDEECRSNICFPTDKLCGKPNGEPCNGNGECRSDICKNGLCRPCAEDANCPGQQLCDPDKLECVDGCRPDSDSGRGVCPQGQICIVPDGTTIGKCQPSGDGGLGDGGPGDGRDFNPGLIEGGGCACNTTTGAASSPLLLAGALCSLWLARRRRRNSHTNSR